MFANRHIREVNNEPNNLAFHNITPPSTYIPPGLKRLLGLNLNFCPTPPVHNYLKQLQQSFHDFARSVRIHHFFRNNNSSSNNYNKKLYVPNKTWKPPNASENIENTLLKIQQNINNIQQPKRTNNNLTQQQRQLIHLLKQNQNLMVIPTDKNLGPALLTHQQYLDLCNEHLKSNIYQLTSKSAKIIKGKLIKVVRGFHRTLPYSKDNKIIIHNLDNYSINYFYGLLKIHKKKLAIRPIVSNAGSILAGLSKWLDFHLQPFLEKIPSFLKDSDALLDALHQLDLEEDFFFFSADVVSMYPNIDIERAINTIDTHIAGHPLHKQIVRGLKLIMTNNYFVFDDKIFLQLNGTAMGTSVAPCFASLFLGLVELEVLSEFPIVLYKRYIDDIFVIMKRNETSSHLHKRMLAKLTQKSKLRFTIELPDSDNRLTFLDLNIQLGHKHINTKTNIKELNLHLYLPASSAHPPGVVKSLIFGRIFKYKKQNTTLEDFEFFVQNLMRRLLDRGHRHKDILPYFKEALARLNTPNSQATPHKQLFIKIPFNPNGISRRKLREIFECEEIVKVLADSDLEKVTICYSRPRNLRALTTQK